MVDGDKRALEEYRLLAAKAALEWRRIGNPTPRGVPGALPGDETVEPIIPDNFLWPGVVRTLSDSLLWPKAADTLK